MSEFLKGKIFEFPRKYLEKAYYFLREVGIERYEAVALFAGSIEADRVKIKKVIIPKQEAAKTEYGLLYSVGGEELHRINLWLHENKLMLVSQIHSHPQEAYHSETDDLFPIVTLIGGLSIVVPCFASREFNELDWAYYRLVSLNYWEEIDKSMIEKIMKIV